MENENHWINKVRSFETETIEEMEDALNEFFRDKFILASPMFHVGGKWYTMVYFKVKPNRLSEDEQIEQQYQENRKTRDDDKATAKQIALMQKLKIFLDYSKLTKLEAKNIIAEKLEQNAKN